MSNSRKVRHPGDPNPVSDLIAAMDGARIPGGCDSCNAYQLVKAHALGSRNFHLIEVYHDDWCPELAAHQAGEAGLR
jgi:hypothetical protein